MDVLSENNQLDLDMYPRPPSQKDIAEQIQDFINEENESPVNNISIKSDEAILQSNNREKIGKKGKINLSFLVPKNLSIKSNNDS